MAAPSASTLYPKITTHIPEVLKTFREPCQENNQQDAPLDPIPIIGTVKLHGTHADIVVHNNNHITFQSRNIPHLDPLLNDNQNFAKSMTPRAPAILALRDAFLARWKTLNPSTPLSPTHPVIIAGEWIGSTIQKGVAISQLSRRFAIISLHINGAWVPDASYADIDDAPNALHHISRGGIFHATLDPSALAASTAALAALADDVAAACPFAASFGAHGEGEGLVWKPDAGRWNGNPALWFKTKGGRFKPTFAPAPTRVPVGRDEVREAAAVVAGVWCTVLRMEQAWAYLGEMGWERDVSRLGAFLKWVQKDVVVEEKGFIAEHGIDVGVLRIEIAKIAKRWYLDRLERGDG